MTDPIAEQEELDLMLQVIRKNIHDNELFLDMLQNDQDVILADQESEELSLPLDGELEEL